MHRFNILVESDNPDTLTRVRALASRQDTYLDTPSQGANRHYTRITVTDADTGEVQFLSIMDPDGSGPAPE